MQTPESDQNRPGARPRRSGTRTDKAISQRINNTHRSTAEAWPSQQTGRTHTPTARAAQSTRTCAAAGKPIWPGAAERLDVECSGQRKDRIASRAPWGKRGDYYVCLLVFVHRLYTDTHENGLVISEVIAQPSFDQSSALAVERLELEFPPA